MSLKVSPKIHRLRRGSVNAPSRPIRLHLMRYVFAGMLVLVSLTYWSLHWKMHSISTQAGASSSILDSVFPVTATPSDGSPRVVHHIEHTYDVLKKQELSEWGTTTYTPNRVLCAVPTTWDHSKHRIKRVQETWGPFCDILVWAVADEFPIPQNVTVGEILVVHMNRSAAATARNIWEKTHRMWVAIADKYIDQAEWFVKLDDDSFLFVETLKEYTKYYNPHIPRYLGHTVYFRWKRDNIVFNTGVTYILSRESLKRLSTKLRLMKVRTSGSIDQCLDRPGAGEDTSVGICLREMGIQPDNTLDELGRQRFFAFQLESHYTHMRNDEGWYWKYKPRVVGDGENCCVPKEEIITVHGYKKERDDERYYKLHNDSLKYHGLPRRVPPKPMPFIYDDGLDFKVDEWRNRLPLKEKAAFQGYSVKK